MEIYGQKDNYEDLASGRVLYGTGGIPNFPVRLQIQILSRAKKYLKQKEGLRIYDPCCGGGYSLTVSGFIFNSEISSIYGSDIDYGMLSTARKNLSLLSKEGLSGRMDELRKMYDLYHKESHLGAIESCGRLESMLTGDIRTEVFAADCTKALPKICPDIIITDVPYGNLTAWNNEVPSLNVMLERLHEISKEETILAVCMNKKQRIVCEKWECLEKAKIGKRRFEILAYL